MNTVPTEPPTTCPDLTVPANGMISYNMGTTSLRPVNTVATYTCVTGYTLTGDTTRTCGSDGVWSGFAPVCRRKWNGLCTVCLLSVSSPIQLTALLTLTNHYILTVASSFVVTVNTVPTEPPTTCPDLTVPANVLISYIMGTTSLRPVNTVATYTCITGYTLNGGSTTRTCGSDGVWSGSPPTCQGEWNGLTIVCVSKYSSILGYSFLWPSSLY